MSWGRLRARAFKTPSSARSIHNQKPHCSGRWGPRFRSAFECAGRASPCFRAGPAARPTVFLRRQTRRSRGSLTLIPSREYADHLTAVSDAAPALRKNVSRVRDGRGRRSLHPLSHTHAHPSGGASHVPRRIFWGARMISPPLSLPPPALKTCKVPRRWLLMVVPRAGGLCVVTVQVCAMRAQARGPSYECDEFPASFRRQGCTHSILPPCLLPVF